MNLGLKYISQMCFLLCSYLGDFGSAALMERSVFLRPDNASKVFKLRTGVSGFSLVQLLKSTGHVVELQEFRTGFLKVGKKP